MSAQIIALLLCLLTLTPCEALTECHFGFQPSLDPNATTTSLCVPVQCSETFDCASRFRNSRCNPATNSCVCEHGYHVNEQDCRANIQLTQVESPTRNESHNLHETLIEAVICAISACAFLVCLKFYIDYRFATKQRWTLLQRPDDSVESPSEPLDVSDVKTQILVPKLLNLTQFIQQCKSARANNSRTNSDPTHDVTISIDDREKLLSDA